MTATKVGERVELISCSDPHTTIQPGTRGTVRFIDDAGTVHVKWDDGRQLGLIEADGDRWVVIAPAMMRSEPAEQITERGDPRDRIANQRR